VTDFKGFNPFFPQRLPRITAALNCIKLGSKLRERTGGQMKWLVLPAMESIFHLIAICGILFLWHPAFGDFWWCLRGIVLVLLFLSGANMLRRTLGL
jgi:hypothetical protein